jgi:hypothetical protein
MKAFDKKQKTKKTGEVFAHVKKLLFPFTRHNSIHIFV